MTFKIHFDGDFIGESVWGSWVDSTLTLPDDLKSSIDAEWAEAVAHKGKLLFDGPLCRVESWRVVGQRVELALSRTSYKCFWGTNLKRSELPDSAKANALGLSALVETADGFVLLGRRNGRVAYHPNRVHPFAGSATDVEVFAEMRRELEEELDLREPDIAEMRCIGMAEDLGMRQPELIFRVTSPRTRSEIEPRMDGEEHASVVAISTTPYTLRRAAQDSELTPIAAAALELFMRSRRMI